MTIRDNTDVGAILTAIESDACPTGHAAYIAIPQLSPDGILPIRIVTTGTQHYQDRVCGNDFGIEGGVAGALVCKFNIFFYYILLSISKSLLTYLSARQQPFTLGVWSTAAIAQPAAEGFSMDYTQVKSKI